MCMSLKRCHDLTYRAVKTIIVKNLQGGKEPESFNIASNPALIYFRKDVLVRQTVQKKITIRNISFVFKDLINLFLERREGREKEREGEREGGTHQCVVVSGAPPAGDLVLNLDLSPDWESNQRPSDSQASSQSTEPHQPGKNKS